MVILKRGESLETVRSKTGEARLLAAAPGMEVIETTVASGKRLTLVPFDDPSAGAAEIYYILEGNLRADVEGGLVELGPGDTVLADQLPQRTIFVATSDVRFLYITPSPTFHEMSQTLAEMMRLATEVEVRDGYTAEHCLRLQQLSYATGEVLGLDHTRLHYLALGAYMHDLGKARISDLILKKPGKLTEQEWEVMRTHPRLGFEMLQDTVMKPASPIVAQHHERLDGSGYPLGLSGDQILQEAFIVAVADTYDAITTDRPYRKAATPQEALTEIRKFTGPHYPVVVVDAFEVAVKNVEGAA